MKDTDRNTGQLVGLETMLEQVFAEDVRPSLRTARRLISERRIPFVRARGRLMFDPPAVRAALFAQRTAKVRAA